MVQTRKVKTMDKETYKINVAYKGMHDFTVTLNYLLKSKLLYG